MGREDYERARRELELAREGVRGLTSNMGGATVARLYEFTQLVLRHPILSRMLEEIVQTRPTGSSDVRESWRALYLPVLAPRMRELAKTLGSMKTAFANLSPPRSSDVDPFAALRVRRIWEDETFEVAFDRLCNEGEADGLSLDQIIALHHVLPQISSWIDYVVQRAGEEEHDSPAQAHALRLLAEGARRLANGVNAHVNALKQEDELLHGFAQAYSLRPLFDRLKAFDAAATAALTPARSLPLPRPNPDSILGDIEFVTGHLLARLNHGPAKRHVLDRLRSYLEHFAFDDVVRKLEDEEHRAVAANGKARREDILQGEIDRFVFIEGMFPITHAEASRGELDVLLVTVHGVGRRSDGVDARCSDA